MAGNPEKQFFHRLLYDQDFIGEVHPRWITRIEENIEKLPAERERIKTVLFCRLHGSTLRQIALALNRGTERIRQMEWKGIRLLRWSKRGT